MLFDQFPENPELFSEDIKPLVGKIIERHGHPEWRAGVLTNELHGHLGIYTIIGVKMGVRALEYLRTETGSVKIISSAGETPPVSCMNDGLQVSTGATFGHGLISSPPTGNPLTEAMISPDQIKHDIRICLKTSTAGMIREEIAEAVKKYGHTPPYWNYIRKLAVRYWYELDRNEIFDIQDL